MILVFLIAMGADYSFELISIETYAPQFFGHNKIFLGSVYTVFFYLPFKSIIWDAFFPAIFFDIQM